MMDIKPIRTETDYENALAELDRLWLAQARSLEGDKLEILITLVEAYEKKHHPIPPSDPVEAIIHYQM